MDRSTSITLDLLRFVAAALVLVHHFEQVTHVPGISPIASFGHDSVIFFFVLSGFVILHVASTTERSLPAFAIARIARLCSVAVPATLLCAVLVAIGARAGLTGYDEHAAADWPAVIGASLLFLNESLTERQAVPTNVPYWSICYEAWYYAIFAIGWYLRGWQRIALLGLALAAAGAKVLMLFPLWVAGAAIYRIRDRLPASTIAGVLIGISAFACYAALRVTNLDDRLFETSANLLLGSTDAANESLAYSKRFAPDYLIGLLVAALLVAAICAREWISPWLAPIEPAVRALAGSSFSLYLYHSPLLLFFDALEFPPTLNLVTTIAAIVVLARLTEHRKRAWQRTIGGLLRFARPVARN